MSDLVKGFVLGQMSEGYFKGMERTAASLFRPRAAPQRTPTIDMDAVLQAARELDEHVERQDRYIKDLEREVRELRAHSARVEDDRDRLHAWATWAEAELKRRPKAD